MDMAGSDRRRVLRLGGAVGVAAAGGVAAAYGLNAVADAGVTEAAKPSAQPSPSATAKPPDGSTLVTFVGGTAGPWRVDRIQPVRGEALPPAARVAMVVGQPTAPGPGAAWTLRGAVSYERYARRVEHDALAQRSAPLDRPEATSTAMIAIKKSPDWWAMPQDERRRIFEEQSQHITTGQRFLPAIARRLHHSRDLGEPFDFVTWFDYAPGAADAFEDLVTRLRLSPEWDFVVREVDIRLTREGP